MNRFARFHRRFRKAVGLARVDTLTGDYCTAVLGVEFVRERAGEHGESLGRSKLYVDGKTVTEGPMRAQGGPFNLAGDGLCIGFDSADPVSRTYPARFPFKGGRIQVVAVDVSEKQYLDLEREAEAYFATE